MEGGLLQSVCEIGAYIHISSVLESGITLGKKWQKRPYMHVCMHLSIHRPSFDFLRFSDGAVRLKGFSSNRLGDALHGLGHALGRLGKAQADEAVVGLVGAGTEGDAGGDADFGVLEQAFGEGYAIGHAFDRDEAVKGAFGFGPAHAVLARDEFFDDVAALAAALHHRGDEGIAFGDGFQCAVLGEYCGPGIVVGGKLDHLGADAWRVQDPADAPAGHGPGFGETVDDEDIVFGFGDGGEAGGGRVVNQGCVDFVGNDRDAGFASKIKDCLLFAFAHDPAGGIAGRGYEDGFGAGIGAGEQALQVKRPGLAIDAAVQAHKARLAAQADDSLENVGPHRRDDDDVVALGAQALQGDVDGEHRRAGYCDAVNFDGFAGLARGPGGDGLAQIRYTSHESIKSLAIVEGFFGCFADEGRGDDVALAEPERDDVRAAEAQGRNFTNAVRQKAKDFGADRVGRGFGHFCRACERSGPRVPPLHGRAQPPTSFDHSTRGLWLPGRHMTGRPPVLGPHFWGLGDSPRRLNRLRRHRPHGTA